MVLLTFVAVVGCNREKLPKLARVSGTVTMDSQPVADATIMFEPTMEGVPVNVSRTDSTGKYELYYSRGHKGTPPGEYTVRISTYGQTGDEDKPTIRKETVPAKYNLKTELKADVKRGANNLDFALQSGGEIIQPDQPEPTKKKGKR